MASFYEEMCGTLSGLLFGLNFEDLDHFVSEFPGACRGVVDVGLSLNLGGVLFGEGVEVVDFHAFLRHDLGGNLVVFIGIADDAASRSLWDGSGVTPDEVGLGFLETLDEGAEVLLVVVGSDLLVAVWSIHGAKLVAFPADILEVVEAPIEVNNGPFFIFPAGIEPGVELFEPLGGGSAVGEGPVDVGFTLEGFLNIDGVADGDGVTDEEDARKALDICDRSHRSFFLGEGRCAEGGDEENRLEHPGASFVRGRWQASFNVTSSDPVEPAEVFPSEIHYNPTGPDDSEFIELHHRSGHALNLCGCFFSAGIDFTFPDNCDIPLARDARILLGDSQFGIDEATAAAFPSSASTVTTVNNGGEIHRRAVRLQRSKWATSGVET